MASCTAYRMALYIADCVIEIIAREFLMVPDP